MGEGAGEGGIRDSCIIWVKSPHERQALLESRGLRPIEAQGLGPWWERLVHHPLMFVLEKKPSASNRHGRKAHGVAVHLIGPFSVDATATCPHPTG